MKHDITIADVVRLTMAILAVLVGAIMWRENGGMSDFIGAALVVVGILYLMPAPRRYIMDGTNRITRAIRNL